jgi:hypothetical protein
VLCFRDWCHVVWYIVTNVSEEPAAFIFRVDVGSTFLCNIGTCLTHSLTELSPSWKAANCEATQELPSVLWNPKVHYRVQKSPHWSLSCARWIQSIPTHPISLRSISILFTHLRLELPSGLSPSRFPTNILQAFLFSSFVLHALPNSSYLTWSF